MTVQPTRDQLRALADAATPGPWEADHSEEDNSSVKKAGREWWDGLAFAGRQADAEFIAAARTAIPALFDALDQAEADCDYWQARAYEAEKRSYRAEARVKAVEDALDSHAYTGTYTGLLRIAVADIRHALDGDS